MSSFNTEIKKTFERLHDVLNGRDYACLRVSVPGHEPYFVELVDASSTNSDPKALPGDGDWIQATFFNDQCYNNLPAAFWIGGSVEEPSLIVDSQSTKHPKTYVMSITSRIHKFGEDKS